MIIKTLFHILEAMKPAVYTSSSVDKGRRDLLGLPKCEPHRDGGLVETGETWLRVLKMKWSAVNRYLSLNIALLND